MGGYGSGYRYGPTRRRTTQLPSIRVPAFPADVPLHARLAMEYRGRTYSVRITATPQPFGGHRRWFACERCHRRCGVLYLGGSGFACRRCLNLAYPTQNMAPHQRLRHRADELWARVAYEDERGWRMPKKGVRRKTFDRVADLAEAYEEAAAATVLGAFVGMMQRRPGKR